MHSLSMQHGEVFFIMAVSYMWIIAWLSDGKSFVHELDISVDSRGSWKTVKLSTE